MNPQPYDWRQPQRQSPAGLGLIFIKTVRGLFNVFLPLLIFFFFKKRSGESNQWEWMAAGLGGFVLMRAILEFFFYRFHIEKGELVIKSGLLRKQTISLPLEKIQGVQLEQNLYHKLTGVTRMAFDSAGTEKTEVKIDAIGLEKAAALRAFVLENSSVSTDEIPGDSSPAIGTPSEKKLISLGMGDLLRLSLSSNHIEAFFIFLGFLISAFQQLRELVADQIDGWREQASGYIVGGSLMLFSFLFLAVLLISVIVSTLRTFFTYYNFFISEKEKGFRVYGGLLNVKERLVPYRKIQHISWKANWIRQRIGIWILQYHSVGSDAVKENQQVKIPVTQDHFIGILTEKYLPVLDEKTVPANRISRYYTFRRTLFIGLIPALVLAAGLFYPIGWHASWFLLWPLLVFFQVTVFTRRFRYFCSGEGLQIRKGIWGTQRILLRWDKVQKTVLSESLFQQKKSLASLQLQTAGGTVALPYIEKTTALLMMDYALYKAEVSGNSWL